VAAGIRSEAARLGLARVGITSPGPSPAAAAFLRRWLARGYHGPMDWLAREDAVSRRAAPGASLPGVRSVVVATQAYAREDPSGVPEDPRRGVVARYARGEDYHHILVDRLERLHRWIQETVGHPVAGRVMVDAGPFLERDAAWRAGLGWIGRNTMLIHPRDGSYLFLGALLLELELPFDLPFPADHCGSCTRCLDACPTGALLGRDPAGAPVMDARLCISTLTIEERGPIPHELRPLLGNRIFGCDICQEVCPFNSPKLQAGAPAPALAYSPRSDLEGPELISFTARLLEMTGKGYLRAFADSPLARPRRQGMLRNLCVALGNAGDPAAVGVLVQALRDRHPLVRGHAAWALGRIGGAPPRAALEERLEVEEDPGVREELRWALGPG